MRQQLEKIVTEKQLNLTKQIEEEVTFAQKFSKADGEINFKKDSRATVYRKIKAFYPWPSVFFAEPRLGFVKLLDAKDPNNVEIPITVPPGKLAKIQNRVFLGLKDGPLEISELQKAGKQKLKAAEFAKGLQ
jgi:methionyl-tRNA formyltransferase